MDNLEKTSGMIHAYIKANYLKSHCDLHAEVTITNETPMNLTHDQIHRLITKHNNCAPSLACLSEVLDYEGYDD